MKRLGPLAICATIFLISFGALAKEQCVDLFFLAPPPVNTLQAQTPPPTNPEKELLTELIKNRHYPIVMGERAPNGNTSGWFIAHVADGTMYTVTIWRSPDGKILEIIPEILTPRVERLYFSLASTKIPPIETEIRLPSRGLRTLFIDSPVQVKLREKHGIDALQLSLLLKRVPGNVRYYENRDRHYTNMDSYYFFINTGGPKPLQVVMLQEKNRYVLLTAFYPDVYRPPR